MASMRLFLAVAKKTGGTIKKRQSNNGLTYCLYDEKNNPIIYCRPEQFQKIINKNKGLFFYNVYDDTHYIKKQNNK
jgi:hypothetical protein